MDERAGRTPEANRPVASASSEFAARTELGVEDAAGEFAAAFTYTAARLSIDHELTRDILLHGHVGLERAEYDRGKGSETLTSALASATV